MRVALFGSPAFALPVLETLRREHDVLLVVAQPDKPAGRGNRLTPPPVAARAREWGLRLEQPSRLKRNEDFLELVRELDLDVAITAAYGKILPQVLLDIPKHGFLNVHASLLPKYRGAAPIQWALIGGERETGVSIMQTEAGLDTGPVRLVRKLEIKPKDTALTLFEKLSVLGAEALSEALGRLEQGNLPLVPQDDAQATHAPMLGKVLKVLELTPADTGRGRPGEVVGKTAEGLTVACGEGAALVQTVQPPGKPKMGATDWANGYGVKPGASLGVERG